MSRYSVKTITGSPIRRSMRRMNRVFDSMTAARWAASPISPSQRRSDAAFARPGAASAVIGLVVFERVFFPHRQAKLLVERWRRRYQQIDPPFDRRGKRAGAGKRALPEHACRERCGFVAARDRLAPDAACVFLQQLVHPQFGFGRPHDEQRASSVRSAADIPCDRRNSRTGPSCGSVLPMPQSASCSAGSSVRGVALRSTTTRDRHATACAATRRSDRAEAVCASSRTNRSQRTSSRGRSDFRTV